MVAEPAGDGALRVYGAEAAAIGDLAFDAGIPLHELATTTASLEAAFMTATGDAEEYAGHRPGGYGMTDALRFEWVRLRTLRSTYWLIGSALALNVAVALLVAFLRQDDATRAVVVAAVTGGGANMPVPMAVVLLAVLGVFASGHEYRYGTIQPTLTTVPQRVRLFTAKVLVVGATALVVTAVSVLLNVAATPAVLGPACRPWRT